MQFQVTEIEFDFDDAFDNPEEFSFSDACDLTDEIIGSIWEAVDGDDLIEEITAMVGWCIKSIDYRIILDDIESPEHESTFEIDYTTQA